MFWLPAGPRWRRATPEPFTTIVSTQTSWSGSHPSSRKENQRPQKDSSVNSSPTLVSQPNAQLQAPPGSASNQYFPLLSPQRC